MKSIFINIVLLLAVISVFAQNIPVRDPLFIRNIEKASLSDSLDKHSSIKPYYFANNKDVCKANEQYEKHYLHYTWNSKTESSSFTAMPVYDFAYLQAANSSFKNGYIMNFGVVFDYSIGDKFGISYMPTAWMLQIPDYLQTEKIIYSIYDDGFWQNHSYRIYNNIGYSASYWNNSLNNGNILALENDIKISYSPYDFLRLELANSKIFYGDGYRSFLLSDYAPNYPYFKLETSFLNLKYSCVWAKHKSNYSIYNSRQTKFDVFHYLDWKIGERFNLGLFEAIITLKNEYGLFDFEYLNPIIFFRPVEFNLGSEDNALLGINGKFKINNRNALYGQFVLDDLIVGQLINDIKHTIKPDYTGEYGWFANKWAAQIGIKSYDIFKIENLDFFTEINIARPYIYSHVNPKQNYSHAAHPLAHPLGGNFVESVSGVQYFGKKININFTAMYAIVGMDSTDSHFGQDIFQSTMDGGNASQAYHVNSYYNTILQGVKTDIVTAKLDFGYRLNENKNLSLNCGILFRYYMPEIGTSTNLNVFYIGIKSNFLNYEMIY